MAASHTRVRVAPNLYQRGDGVFVAGLTVEGRWTMKTARRAHETRGQARAGRPADGAPRRPARSPSPSYRFGALADEFLRRFDAQVNSGERSPRTLDQYSWALRCYLCPAWDDVDVARNRSGRRRRPHRRATRERQGSVDASRRRADRQPGVAVRRAAWLLGRQPGREVERGERAHVVNDDRRVLGHREIERLLDAAASSSSELAMLGLLLYAGLRQGEVARTALVEYRLRGGPDPAQQAVAASRKGQTGSTGIAPQASLGARRRARAATRRPLARVEARQPLLR